MINEILIRRMELKDVDAVHAIEAAVFTMPWSRDSFVKEMTENCCARYLVLESSGEIKGFAGIWIIMDEGHITNIAISAELRGLGYGRKLTQALIQYAANLMVRYITLEVRRSNSKAQRLYQSLGFTAVGYRKRYYEDNAEDALLMVNEHLPLPEPDFSEAESIKEAFQDG